ncbi:MAG: helix-turn-helix domain-containing protein [Elusimicrobia bacterium]|nr:helix-turn-helix domain-containing protein [Elusimicrobiota bacterium]
MPEHDFRVVAGKVIRRERLRLGWSQEELAEKADLHPSFVGQIERGLRAASFKTLERLGVIFGLKPVDFLAGATEPDAAYKPQPLERKILGLLKGCSTREQQLVYQTIKHLLRQKRRLVK